MIHIHLHYKNMNIVCLYRYRDIQGIHLPCSLTYTKQTGKNTKNRKNVSMAMNHIGDKINADRKNKEEEK